MVNRVFSDRSLAEIGAEEEQATQADELLAMARERASEASESVRSFIEHKPAVALAIAFGIGALLAWLIKRR